MKSLTAQQQKGLEAILSTKSIAEAARQSGISLRTLERWMADADFKAALQSTTAEGLELAVQRMSNGVGIAVDVIVRAMNIGDVSAAQLKAAALLMSALPTLKQLGDTEARLVALERQVKNAKQ